VAGGLENVDQALVRLELELLARLLVDVRRTENRPALRFGRERNRSRYLSTRLLRCADDVRGGLVDHGVIEGFEADANSTGHVGLTSGITSTELVFVEPHQQKGGWTVSPQ
jgi:hypothetical protein